MKLDPGMHIGMHLVFFGKSGVTTSRAGHMQVRKHALRTPFLLGGGPGRTHLFRFLISRTDKITPTSQVFFF
jgi:hypothetical protein